MRKKVIMAKKEKKGKTVTAENGKMENSAEHAEEQVTDKKSKSGDEKEKEIETLKAALDEQKEKYLRLFAEFDNFKKRNVKERLDLMRSAARDTMVALLPVLDDFDRAKLSSDNPGSKEQFSEGVEMVYNRLYQVLKMHGLNQMESDGQEFDPELHEAITEIPAPEEKMKGKIIDTIEKGYYLNDKLIRHAKVVVGK